MFEAQHSRPFSLRVPEILIPGQVGFVHSFTLWVSTSPLATRLMILASIWRRWPQWFFILEEKLTARHCFFYVLFVLLLFYYHCHVFVLFYCISCYLSPPPPNLSAFFPTPCVFTSLSVANLEHHFNTYGWVLTATLCDFRVKTEEIFTLWVP